MLSQQPNLFRSTGIVSSFLCCSALYLEIMSVIDYVVGTQAEATVEQVMQRSYGGRGGLEQDYDAGRVRSVQENHRHEEEDGNDAAGNSSCFHRGT